MKQLLSDSKVILSDAKSKYDQAATEIDMVNSKLEAFKLKMDQMLDENSADHKAWTKGVRAGWYGTAGAMTVGMIIADIFGCLGICSAVGTTTTWAATAAAVESAIAEVTAKIEQMEDTVLNAIDDIESIGDKTHTLKQFIQQETKIIIKWENSVEHVANKIEQVQEESFYRLALKRRSLTEALKNLHDVAKEFFDRPDGIFGDEPLKLKLEDPEEKQKDIDAIAEVEANTVDFRLA